MLFVVAIPAQARSEKPEASGAHSLCNDHVLELREVIVSRSDTHTEADKDPCTQGEESSNAVHDHECNPAEVSVKKVFHKCSHDQFW